MRIRSLLHSRCSSLTAILTALVSVTLSGQLPALEIDGFTEPYRDIDVAAPEMGRVVSVEVSEGDRVAAGQILARLDEEVLNATLDIAKAVMESSGRLEAAQAELHMHQETLLKLEKLQERNHATQREVNRACAQRDMAEARVKGTQEELRVKTLEFARTRTQLARRQVHSPISGVVTRVYKDEGEFVSPSDPVVIKVVQLDPLLVVFAVPIAEAAKLKVNQPVKVRIESARQPVQGIVEFVSPTADAQSGTTRVRVKLPNEGEAISSGVTCHLLLPGNPKEVATIRPAR